MTTLKKIQIEFDDPEHGWILTTIRYGDFQLVIDISDVPVDPMVLLCDALIEINKGIKEPTRVVWHLEPYCYYLQLKRLDQGFSATILESDAYEGPTKITTEIHGTYEEIILPFYRALKKFWSKSFKEPHWDVLDPKRIATLTEMINERKKL